MQNMPRSAKHDMSSMQNVSRTEKYVMHCKAHAEHAEHATHYTT